MANKESQTSKQVRSWSSLPNIDHEPRYHVQIASKTKISKDMLIFSFDRPKDFVFIPGQYIWMVLPELTKYFGVVDRNDYYIASKVDDEKIEILIDSTIDNFAKKS